MKPLFGFRAVTRLERCNAAVSAQLLAPYVPIPCGNVKVFSSNEV